MLGNFILQPLDLNIILPLTLDPTKSDFYKPFLEVVGFN